MASANVGEEIFNLFTSNNSGKRHEPLGFNLRTGFIRKVFGILSAQLLVTALFIILGQSSNMYKSRGLFFPVVAGIGTIITALLLSLSTSWARQVPKNYITLAIFTLCESYAVGYITSDYPATTVAAAAALTTAITIALFIYSVTTKTDISYFGALLFMLSLGGLLLSIFCIFFPSAFLVSLLSFMGAVSYGIYIIYDIQLIVGGHRFAISEDDYIRAAMYLYVDIVQLFIRLVKILSTEKKSNKKEDN